MQLADSETGLQNLWSQFQMTSSAEPFYIYAFEFALLATKEQDMSLPSSSHQGQHFCWFPILLYTKKEMKRIEALPSP